MSILFQYIPKAGKTGWVLPGAGPPPTEAATAPTAFLMGKRVKGRVLLSCPALCDPRDYTVHGILQAGILE